MTVTISNRTAQRIWEIYVKGDCLAEATVETRRAVEELRKAIDAAKAEAEEQS